MNQSRWPQWRAQVKNWWNARSESQRDLWRLLLGAVGLLLLGTLGYFAGRPLWMRWQRRQALAQVQLFAQKNDYQNAALALRRTLELAPADPAAWQQAVQLLSELGSPDVLAAREQLLRLTPGDTALKLALVADALRLDRSEVAEQTLAKFTDGAQRDAAFYRLATALAVALGRADQVEALLASLVQAAPGDSAARFNLAAVRLWNVESAVRAKARAELEQLTADPAVRLRAALELLKDAARQHDTRRLKQVVGLLLARFAPGQPADFSGPDMPGWVTLREGLKQAAEQGGAADAALLARWLADLGERREALLWLETLPPAMRTMPAVLEAQAEFAAVLDDLERTERLLQAGAWGHWPREALTLAVAAHLQRLRFSETHGRATWEDALTACGNSLPGLRAMVRLAGAWKDDAGLERGLLVVLEKQPQAWWAYDGLRGLYAGRRDLPRLLQLYERWTHAQPADADLACTWVTLSALLDRVDPAVANTAEMWAKRRPDSAMSLVSLAAVRWRQGRAAEAIVQLRRLSPEQQKQPPIAFWLCVALSDSANPADKKQAAEALRHAWQPSLPPEQAGVLRAAAAKAGLLLEY